MKHPSKFSWFTRHSGSVRLGLALVLAFITIGIVGCPWFDKDEDDTNPITPNITPPAVAGYELKNFQVIRPEDGSSWCAWVKPADQFHVNLPEPGDYLFTITTQQATFRIVARVYDDGTLIFTLQTNDRLISGTAQAGIIHAPAATKAVPINEGDYQPPQIWPVPPYATLFAWPADQGIGAWDQIFEPDPDARILTLAETEDGVLDTWDCPRWASFPTLSPTETPVPPSPTAIPIGPNPTPTIAPTATPVILPTVTPIAPTATPTTAPTAAPTVTPTITYRIESCGWDDQMDRMTLANISPAVADIELRVEVYDRNSATPGIPVETGTYLTDAFGTARHEFLSGGCPILYAVWSFVNAAQGTTICTTGDLEPPC